MPWFDIIKKVADELQKENPPGQNKGTTPPSPPQQRRRNYPKRGYGKIAYWLKTNYGNRFVEGASTVEIENQLTNIFGELQTKPFFKQYPQNLNGFKAYIAEKKFGDLVRVS